MHRPVGSRGRACGGRALVLLLCLIGTPVGVAAQGGRAELARARVLYNERQFDDAIAAATAARAFADTADASGIVLARAHLERYRERADPADLSAAREVLNSIRAAGLDTRDQVEMLLAVGQSLFLEDDFGAAAAIFESTLDRAAAHDRVLAEALLEWWGSAVERQADSLAREARAAVFRRLATRMRDELARTPSSAGATYWLVVSLRGAGEIDGAWDAAVAAWARARLVGERAPSLRADLDRLVLQGIIPDKVRQLAQEQRPGSESQFRAEWELVKERWK
jgi:hypothetical protein